MEKSIISFHFFLTRAWTQDLHLEPLHQHFFFVMGVFEIGSLKLFAQAGFEPRSYWYLPLELLGLQPWAPGARLKRFWWMHTVQLRTTSPPRVPSFPFSVNLFPQPRPQPPLVCLQDVIWTSWRTRPFKPGCFTWAPDTRPHIVLCVCDELECCLPWFSPCISLSSSTLLVSALWHLPFQFSVLHFCICQPVSLVCDHFSREDVTSATSFTNRRIPGSKPHPCLCTVLS
jgi:hypothetical protein